MSHPTINFCELVKNYNSGNYLKMILVGVKDVWNMYNHILSIDKEETYLITLVIILKIIDKYRPNIHIVDLEPCSICMEQYKINQKIYRTNCHHHFCKDCLQEWCKRNNSCPLCRTEIIDLKEILYQK
jgi:hypothetical protein